ncbi:MAG: hypothetical protein ACI9B9_000644 [Halioglobus sp.]|jgi:hypothetical protein
MKHVDKSIFALAFGVGLALSVTPVLACGDTGSMPLEESKTTPLKAYTAQYKTSAKGLNLTLKRALTRSKDGQYTLTNGGGIFIAGFEEESLFRVEGAKIVPESYVYQGSGLMNRRREVQFTEGAETVRSLYKEQWYELPYSEGLLDRMSQQEQIRLHLLTKATPEEDVVMTVIDGKRIKDYSLKFVAKEMLQTPLGNIETLHFERMHSKADRKSDSWVAPAWDYLMVKTTHIEDGKLVEGVIIAANIDGVQLGTAQ